MLESEYFATISVALPASKARPNHRTCDAWESPGGGPSNAGTSGRTRLRSAAWQAGYGDASEGIPNEVQALAPSEGIRSLSLQDVIREQARNHDVGAVTSGPVSTTPSAVAASQRKIVFQRLHIKLCHQSSHKPAKRCEDTLSTQSNTERCARSGEARLREWPWRCGISARGQHTQSPMLC